MMRRVLQVLVVTTLLAAFYAAALGWSVGTVLSCFLTTATLAVACNGMGSTRRGERIVILAWLYWGLSYVSNLVEALYFHVIAIRDAEHAIATGFALAVLAASILVWLMPLQSLELSPRQVSLAPHLWWRIPLLAVLFFVVYLSAGAAIFHWVASFYKDRPLPSVGQLLVLQVCRGLLDIACVLPLFLRWNSSRQSATWLSACIFAILCGLGPLLLPNAFMPAPIRFAHGIEMGVSGVVFGIVTALLLLKTDRRGQTRA